MDKINIACKNGAVVSVPCKDKGQIIYVSRQDIPKGAFACFNDEPQACMIAESGRFLDVLPESEMAGDWYSPD